MDDKEFKLIREFPRISHEILRKLIYGFEPSQEDMCMHHTQLRTLFVLFDNGEMTMTELHKIVGLEKGSLTSVIDQLIKKNFVQRNGDPNDRRKVNITLSEYGRKKVEILHMESTTYIKNKLEKIPAKDRERFYQTVNALMEINKNL
jgi:DNA-binding MarR family transcriptional regulator